MAYVGHNLIEREEIKKYNEMCNINFEYDGPVLNISSEFSVSCGAVAGNATAGDSIECKSIKGSACAGGDINYV